MLVVLPDRMDGIKSLEKTFLSDSTKFPILLANMTIHNVILAIPKFKFESDLNLEKTMEHVSTYIKQYINIHEKINLNFSYYNNVYIYE